MFRYWDGNTWSATVTHNPATVPIPGSMPGHTPASMPGQDPTIGQSGWDPYQPVNVRATPTYLTSHSRDPQQGYRTDAPQPPARQRNGMWWIALVAIVLAVILFSWWALGKAGVGAVGGEPASNPTDDVCPRNSIFEVSAPPIQTDGRVHGGKLSYPELRAPWSAPTSEYRVPFGRNALTQDIMVEPDYRPNQSWVASVLVAELAAGDGFFSPEAGMDIVARCIVGAFYGDAEVDRDDIVNKATTVDGHDAWLLETHLSFEIPGLKTTGELALIMIVNTGPETNSIFYASIPDTVPQYVQPARNAMKALTVCLLYTSPSPRD